MKYRNMKTKYRSLDLQLFAEEGDGGADGGETGEEAGEDEAEEEDDPEEKKFSQKDLDEAVKKRLAREKRKWVRQRQEKPGTGRSGAGEKVEEAEKEKTEESEDIKARKAAEEKAEALEVKIACFEAGVTKDAVDDVTALARAYMTADEALDLEDAVEKVVKKYPQFKKSSSDPYENVRNKSWGERQRGGAKKATGVEAAFLKRNPGLKIE